MKQPLTVFIGPTVVGKTVLSARLAKAVGREVTSVNSMQVYGHTDIGSAKTIPMETDGAPRYLIDILDPQKPFSVVTLQQMAREALKEIYSHGRIPVIARGTGFHIQVLLYDVDFKENEDNSPVCRELEALAEREGERTPRLLHSIFHQVDPEAAVQIHANNIKCVIRAIKYFRQTGEKTSPHNQQEREKKPPYNFLYYVLNTDRVLLYGRIDRRIGLMAEQGLTKGAKASRDMGCRGGYTPMQGLGHKEIPDYLEGRCSLEEAVYVPKRGTERSAKCQLIWLGREREVRFLNFPEFKGDVSKVLERILRDYVRWGIVLQ